MTLSGLENLLFTDLMGQPAWLWCIFLGIVALIMIFDLGVLNRKSHEIGYRESLFMSMAYVSLALLFGAWVWMRMGHDAGLEFYTGYLIEYTLSLDNIFMMSVIFAYFKIPRQYQHRVLFWGILGVIVLRGIMIAAGTALLHEFEWLLLIFGAFLIYTGAKMLFEKEEDKADLENSKIVHFLERHMRITKTFDGHKFLVRKETTPGQFAYYATPLLLALVTIELVDVIFAVDSIPAVFAITTDPFIVFTSNIFAVMGLRTLYFLLAAMVHQFRYLTTAVSIVLIFIGGKVFYAQFFGKVDSVLSLSVTIGVLGMGLLLSVLRPEKQANK